MSMKPTISLFIFFIFLFHSSASEFVLTKNKVCLAPIIVYENAPPRTVDAANTLAHYIEKISGVKPEVITQTPKTLPKKAIWVGIQESLKTLFPQTKIHFTHPEEILIHSNENHLILAGRDRWNPETMEGRGRLAVITGRQQEYGSVNAVYTFIQDHLGVRWLWPGKLGEDIPRQENLSFKPIHFRYHPQFRDRMGVFRRLDLGYSKEGPAQLWARHLRLQLDSLNLEGGHGFGDWWDDYHKDHPDYFAMQLDGSRNGWPGGKYAKLCDSNPKVWDQWLKEVEQTLKEHPQQTIFNASPNDGWPNGHCNCDNCRAWDVPSDDLLPWRWQGVLEERPAITDRHMRFANELSKKLTTKYPNKNYLIQMHAYGLSRPAPLQVKPNENILITNVSNFVLRGNGVDDQRDLSRQQFDDWSKKAKQMAWRPNLGNPAGLRWGLPDIVLSQVDEDFKFVAERNGIGLFFDLFEMNYATQGPMYYLMAQLAWDPSIDADKVMNDYYLRAYGPAADEVKKYWTLMEKTRHSFLDKVKNKYRTFDIPQHFNQTILDEAWGYLNSATEKTKESDQKYLDRVQFIKYGLEYSALVLDTRTWMQKFEKSKSSDTQAKEKVLENWKAFKKMKATFPPFAINWQFAFHKPEGKHMRGLHPDYPLSGQWLRKKLTPYLE